MWAIIGGKFTELVVLWSSYVSDIIYSVHNNYVL